MSAPGLRFRGPGLGLTPGAAAPGDLLAGLLAAWRPLKPDQQIRLDAQTQGGFSATNVLVSGNVSTNPFRITPADLAVPGKTTKIKLAMEWEVGGAAAPGASTVFKAQLLPITAFSGASAAINVSVGASILDTATVTGPAIGDNDRAVSSEIDVPAVGPYIVVVTLSGANMAAQSVFGTRVCLLYRYV